jgi:MFS family permease
LPNPSSGALLIGLAYVGFVSLGLPDGLLGVASPSIRASFSIGPEQLGALLIAFTAGYLSSSAASGAVLRRLGVGALLAWSCVLTAASLLVYAATAHWWLMVAFGVVSGLGAGAIDAGLNTWVATFHGARTVNWLHAFYGIGAMSGPLVMTAVLASGHAWRRGYAIVGAGQLVLAIAFAATRRRWPDVGTGVSSAPAPGAAFAGDRDDAATDSATPPTVEAERVGATATAAASASPTSTLRLPLTWLSLAIFFLYTGLEAATGVWAFSLLTESRHIAPVTAGVWTSGFWLGSPSVASSSARSSGSRRSRRSSREPRRARRRRGACSRSTWAAPRRSPAWSCSGSRWRRSSLDDRDHAARLGARHAANGVGFQIAAASLGQSLLPAFVGVLVARYGVESLGPALVLGGIALLLLHEVPGVRIAETRSA